MDRSFFLIRSASMFLLIGKLKPLIVAWNVIKKYVQFILFHVIDFVVCSRFLLLIFLTTVLL